MVSMVRVATPSLACGEIMLGALVADRRVHTKAVEPRENVLLV